MSNLYGAWQEPAHADAFDFRARLSDAELRQAYEGFNEFRLFLRHRDELRGRDFVEVGCATGELYRYLRRFHPEFRYTGFDVSEPAVGRARQKFPAGRFERTEPDLGAVKAAGIEPSVVWCRDVLQHQEDPLGALAKLLALPSEAVILRLRTRDRGATVLDPERSCQWHYGTWVPYIIVNTDELIRAITRAGDVRRVEVLKRLETLGGQLGRFVPKDCYDPATGTAETAVYIARGAPDAGGPEVVVEQRDDFPRRGPLWRRGVRFVARRLRP